MAPKTNKDVQAAAEKIVLDPSLTAKEALLQVGVSEDLASNKYWQKNVRRKRNTIERHRNIKLAKKQKASHTPNTGKSQPTLSHPPTSTSITIPEYPKEIIELKDTEVGRMREKAIRDLINISEGQFGTAFGDKLRGLFEEAKKHSNGDGGVKFDMSQLHNHENSGDD